MSMVEIQKLLFPEIGKCMEVNLYYHIAKNEFRNDVLLDTYNKIISFNARNIIHFDTYFNGLTAAKWFKYTKIDNVNLLLRLKGEFIVTLIQKEKINDIVFEKIIERSIVKSESLKEFNFYYKNTSEKGMYCFSLESLAKDSEYHGGYYYTNIDESFIDPVKIGVGICTFKREKFIEKNLEILKKTMEENACLRENFSIFVSDNGHTLNCDRLQDSNIRIFYNKNVGGAGGFTRDLIEMKRSGLGLTHALLMDDDVIIEPESFLRTFWILSLLKEEWKGSFIGGSMLRLDMQSVQVENGASWNGGNIKSLKAGLNLNNIENCLQNEVEEYMEFNAWWYCCFPLSVASDDNLPMPIFIRGDDLEYSLRNMKNLILMNGICVWHEPFENKYSSFLDYYIIRNLLIDNSFHFTWYGARHLKRNMFGHCIRELFYYRYKNVDLYLKGINDFLKGPKYLMKQDGELLHKEIMSKGYKGKNIKECSIQFDYSVYERSIHSIRNDISFWRLICLNGLFIPTNKNNITSMAGASPCHFFRKKRVMQYDVNSGNAFETTKSIGKTLVSLNKMILMSIKITFVLNSAQKKWRNDGVQMRTLEFWEQYLGI